MSLPMNPLAQVAHAKSQLSENGEYVPTAREFEHTLRDVGCSQRVAKRILAKVYDGEVREVLTDDDDGERDVLSLIQAMKDDSEAVQIKQLFRR